MSGSDIAVLDLIAVTAAGERRAVHFRLGRPAPDGAGAWACPVTLTGLHAGLAPVIGEDALQALCLALGLVASLFRDLVARGGHLEYATGGEFPVEAYFGRLGEFGAPAP